MNALDVCIAVIVLAYAVRGVRRGLALGLADLVGLLFVLFVSFAGYAGLAPLLARLVGVDIETARVVAFFGLFIVASVLYSLVVYSALLRPRPAGRRTTGRSVNQLLGLLPGLLQGLVVAALLAAALTLLPLNGSLVAQAEGSALAPYLRRASARLAPDLERIFSVGLRRPLLQVTSGGTGGTRQLNFPGGLRLSVDADGERRMLELINRDRAAQGLRPLEMDPELRTVARAHSTEMFRLSYFAHESPRTGGPEDRLGAADVSYMVAGENLAYQPSVEVAHRELMKSPSHRRNILSPLFRRVGIGAVRGGLYGEMFTQEFTD